ncbi:TPR repeat-containing thioredoxin TTL1 [Euphorbia peplus]|nr:TPR repeat-containing thioredoxin TTL1 [Euphorbia peplus]
MTEMAKYGMEHQQGCGFMRGILGRRSFWNRKTPVYSLPIDSDDSKKLPPVLNSKQRSKSEVAILAETTVKLGETTVKLGEKHRRRHSLVDPPRYSASNQPKSEGRRSTDAARSSTSSSSYVTPRKSSDSRALVRATSSNVMVIHELGNLRQPGNGSIVASNSPRATIRTVENVHKHVHEVTSVTPRTANSYSKLGSSVVVMGNIVRQSSGEIREIRQCPNKMDAEGLKNLGNDRYKKGRFEEALGLYDQAIALDSSKATYRSNKSAALIGLGRLMDAVVECKEAIKLDPSYQRAHYRLGTLYFRLGEAEKALHHYKQSGLYAKPEDIAQTQILHKHLSKCNGARKSQEWNTMLKEADLAISSGADSSPQVYIMQAEALLRLFRHEEAYKAYRRGPNFSIESCTKCFGVAITCHLLTVGTHVYMAVGRFEDAVAAAEEAARLDLSNREINTLVKTARGVASARLSGNLLYKASKFVEACVAYSEGLEYDPYNSVLLCNRAACRSKLEQFEKAVGDCTIALRLQPNYSKARLRRAHCNAKMGKWEDSIEDYEMLIRESPADEEVGRALFEAKIQLKKQRGEDTKDLKFGSNLVFISSNELFRYYVTLPGMSVVLFCNKENHGQVLNLMEQVCKRFPSVNFLKVEVEDHPYLAKSEKVTSVPSFKIYKNGTRVKEIPAINSSQLLEKSLKLYSS